LKPDPQPVLTCTDVSKSYGGVHALQGVSLAIAPGEIVGLIGPNGSGKSTLLHCLGGATTPTRGSIHLQGRDVTGAKPFRLARMGLSRTFQRNRVFNEMTILENVLASCDWSKVGLLQQVRRPAAAVRERALVLLAAAGLQPYVDRLASEISGGQRRLLEIAMALMPAPKILMLDEATSGVNPTMIESFVEYLREVNATQHSALLIVEHNLQFITALATRVVALEQGRVLVEGTPDQVMSDPRVIEAYLGG
jgi:ABC-type branched-subunit amino acid transport system ATPase component